MGIIRLEPLSAGSKRVNVPELIVVHSMGEYILDPDPEHAVDFLERYGLSAHALVSPNGDIYLCRDDDQGAYHARGHNTNSLGIEILVEGRHDYGSFIKAIAKWGWCPDVQFDATVEAVRNWIQGHDIKRIVRHSDISPGRKVDPGSGFDWVEFQKRIAA